MRLMDEIVANYREKHWREPFVWRAVDENFSRAELLREIREQRGLSEVDARHELAGIERNARVLRASGRGAPPDAVPPDAA